MFKILQMYIILAQIHSSKISKTYSTPSVDRKKIDKRINTQARAFNATLWNVIIDAKDLLYFFLNNNGVFFLFSQAE